MSARKVALLSLLAVAGAGGAWWWINREPPPLQWQGYAEADFVKIGPTQQGLLIDACRRARRQGRRRAPRCSPRTTPPTAPRAIRRHASSARPRSSSPICRPSGKPTEIQQAEANLADAKAARDTIQSDLKRDEMLVKTNAVSQQLVDQLRADQRSAKPRCRASRRRSPRCARRWAASARSRRSRRRSRRRGPRSTWRNGGSISATSWRRSAASSPTCWRARARRWRPAAPVVSLLPPENIFVRFFVPEPRLAEVHRRRPGRARLRPLPGRPRRHHLLHLAAGRIHAAGDLQRIEPRQARLPGRGAPVRGAGRADQSRPADRGAPWQRPRADGAGEEDRAGRAMTELVIDVHELRKSFGARRVVDGLDLAGRGGRDLRLSRRQRQRQDDDHPHAVRPARRPTAAAAPASASTSSATRRASAGRSAT